MKGMVHHNKLAAMVKEIKPASAQGLLYRLPVGYPAMVDGEGTVKGELLTLDNYKEIIKFMDEFEGYSIQNPEKSLTTRVEKQVFIDDGKSPIMADVYLLNPAKLPKDAKLIDGGDYRASMAGQTPLPLQLTDSQKKYILKLGASSGRDIVPINLDIYRDLLNKGLIVDKGRRLALTNLGSEVFRFLA
ncbi:MAG: gamma-glutamylcyclotransferase [Oligoflexia bacterium]|nr:gamma-glutamylcyclotransferase [Oligoflexia bacterium]